MYTLRTILASEALLILTSAVYGMVTPEALIYGLTGETFSEAASAIPWMCSLAASVALLQIASVDDIRRRSFRALMQARLVGDLMLVSSVVLHDDVSIRYLSIVAITLVYSATRVYALVLVDEPELTGDFA